MRVLLTLEDFPQDSANCGNCTRKGGACERTKNNKQQHNGYLFGIGGDDIERHPNLEEFAIKSMKSYDELDDMAIEELGGYDYLMKECYNEW